MELGGGGHYDCTDGSDNSDDGDVGMMAATIVMSLILELIPTMTVVVMMAMVLMMSH